MKYSKKDIRYAKNIFEASLEKNQLKEVRLLSFISKIKRMEAKNSLGMLRALLKEVSNFYKKQTLIVESSVDLQPRYLNEIKRTFDKRIGRSLKLEIRKNKALLGGLKISHGDNVWDYSVNQTLESFKEAVRG